MDATPNEVYDFSSLSHRAALLHMARFMSANGAGKRLVATLPTSPSKARYGIDEVVLAARDGSSWVSRLQDEQDSRSDHLYRKTRRRVFTSSQRRDDRQGTHQQQVCVPWQTLGLSSRQRQHDRPLDLSEQRTLQRDCLSLDWDAC